jgi:CDP-glucose 4,6-dehydratase
MVKLQNNFFSNKKVLITGHTGFKGAWLTQVLHSAGADIAGFSLAPSSTPSMFDLLNLKNKINHVIGDIRNLEEIQHIFDEHQPEIVIHLAAQAIVKTAYGDPVATFATNTMGAVNLLETVKKSQSVKSLVFITSDKCYENLEWIWGYREDDKLGGRDPYSASKASAEIIFSSYYRSFLSAKPGFDAATARAGNVIGGGDWSADRIIPDCIRAIQNDEAIVLRSPQAIRPWQHVLEPLSGYLLLAQKLYEEPDKWNGAWNFGPSTREVVTVNQVAESIVQHLGKGRIETNPDSTNFHEATLLQLNCDKAHQLLNWYPRWNVKQTMEYTASWYKAHMDNAEIASITEEQIGRYFQE